MMIRNYELERVYKEGIEAVKKLREIDQYDPIVKYIDELLNVQTKDKRQLDKFYEFFQRLKSFI